MKSNGPTPPEGEMTKEDTDQTDTDGDVPKETNANEIENASSSSVPSRSNSNPLSASDQLPKDSKPLRFHDKAKADEDLNRKRLLEQLEKKTYREKKQLQNLLEGIHQNEKIMEKGISIGNWTMSVGDSVKENINEKKRKEARHDSSDHIMHRRSHSQELEMREGTIFCKECSAKFQYEEVQVEKEKLKSLSVVKNRKYWQEDEIVSVHRECSRNLEGNYDLVLSYPYTKGHSEILPETVIVVTDAYCNSQLICATSKTYLGMDSVVTDSSCRSYFQRPDNTRNMFKYTRTGGIMNTLYYLQKTLDQIQFGVWIVQIHHEELENNILNNIDLEREKILRLKKKSNGLTSMLAPTYSGSGVFNDTASERIYLYCLPLISNTSQTNGDTVFPSALHVFCDAPTSFIFMPTDLSVDTQHVKKSLGSTLTNVASASTLENSSDGPISESVAMNPYDDTSLTTLTFFINIVLCHYLASRDSTSSNSPRNLGLSKIKNNIVPENYSIDDSKLTNGNQKPKINPSPHTNKCDYVPPPPKGTAIAASPQRSFSGTPDGIRRTPSKVHPMKNKLVSPRKLHEKVKQTSIHRKQTYRVWYKLQCNDLKDARRRTKWKSRREDLLSDSSIDYDKPALVRGSCFNGSESDLAFFRRHPNPTRKVSKKRGTKSAPFRGPSLEDKVSMNCGTPLHFPIEADMNCHTTELIFKHRNSQGRIKMMASGKYIFEKGLLPVQEHQVGANNSPGVDDHTSDKYLGEMVLNPEIKYYAHEPEVKEVGKAYERTENEGSYLTDTFYSEFVVSLSSPQKCYSEYFGPSCDRKSGLTCARHARPVLLRPVKSVSRKCSKLNNLSINKTRIRVRNPEQIFSSKPSKKTQESRGFSITDSKLYDDLKADASTLDISSTPQESFYGVSRSFLQNMTLLLHALNFEAILEHGSESEMCGGLSDIPSLFIAGLSHFKLGNSDKARSKFLRCDELCLICNKRGDSALCNLYLGDINFLSRSFSAACSHYQKAISSYSVDTVAVLFRMMPPSLSTIHSKHGSALRNASKIVDAVQAYKLAIKEATTLKDSLAANTSLGNLYQSVGENTSALSHYQQSIEIAEKLGENVSLSWAHGNIGNAFLGLFQKEKAIYHLQKALDLTLQFEPTPQAIGRAYNNLGTAFQSIGDLDKAEEHYEYALSQAIYGKDTAGQARVCGNMGNIFMLRKKYEKAVPQYSDVLSISKDRSTISTARHNRGCAYYEWGEASSDKRVKINTLKGQTIVKFKFYLHGPSLSSVSTTHKPQSVSEVAASLYTKSCEDLNEVISFHEEHLDNIKGSPKGLTLSVSLFETNSRTFHRLQDSNVCLGKYLNALLVAEQSRSRTLGELMLKKKGWQLQIPLTSPLSFDHIMSVVETTDYPILYLSYTGARLLGWVVVSQNSTIKMNMFEVPLADDQFDGKPLDHHLRFSLTESLVERNFEMYREVGDYNEFTSAPVQTLYNLIAKPLLTILQNYQIHDVKLVVICDSYTALIPFSSLHDPETDTFLGDRFTFQLMPSFLTMGIMNQLSNINVVNFPARDQDVCIVGNPTIPVFKYNSEVLNLGNLPYAKREAEAVAHILKAEPILERQATRSAVLMRLLSAKIIHLATHGSASAGFLAFSQLASVERIDVANFQGILLFPEEVEKLDISPALVVLSSCDSGRGVVKADGIQSMARAFILAGAQAVLTTLWRVPDESASIFMQFFYQYMKDGLESTKALQKAILSIRCFSKYSQYIHWSGYQLTGRDIYLRYIEPEEKCVLENRLGYSNVFPRLDDVKSLQTNLVSVSCFPTDVQLILADPGFNPHEVVIDFIHKFYNHFTGGIFWINCSKPEFIADSITYIEKHLGGPLESLSFSSMQQSLFVLDDVSELPSSLSLLQLLRNRYAHCIILHYQTDVQDTLIHAIDRGLIRGCTVHRLETLSMILSTQRIVYLIQKKMNIAPKCNDQEIIEKLSYYSCGSPVLVDIVSQLLCFHLQSSSLKTFQENILKNDNQPDLSLPSSHNLQAKKNVSVRASNKLSSISSLTLNDKDMLSTSSKYDSWESITKLFHCSELCHESKLLLYCLSQLGNGPIPVSIVSSISTLITEGTDKTHLAGSLLSQLKESGYIKAYPSPFIISSQLKLKSTTEFVYVPKILTNCLSDQLDQSDLAFALAMPYKLFKQAKVKCLFLNGLVKYLAESCELNIELVGEKCCKEVHRLSLSFL